MSSVSTLVSSVGCAGGSLGPDGRGLEGGKVTQSWGESQSAGIADEVPVKIKGKVCP